MTAAQVNSVRRRKEANGFVLIKCDQSPKKCADTSSKAGVRKQSQEAVLVLNSKLTKLKRKLERLGCGLKDLKLVLRSKSAENISKTSREVTKSTSKWDQVLDYRQWASVWIKLCTLVVFMGAIVCHEWSSLATNRCAIGNNYFVMEMSRPVTDCNMCKYVDRFTILENPSKEEFARFAYSGRPILVRGATGNWSALSTFSFDFFKRTYSQINDAYQSVEEECQFFPFRTEFLKLRQVFSMPTQRVNLSDSRQKPWYIGWSNCNPDVAQVLRQHYRRPHFLPDDSESSAIDWIFMGYSGQGASMHLDYVQRPSWQAQVSGTKSWHLLPPPECEFQCKPIKVTVNRGDIILIDTNQWYHDTYIHPGEMSITIGSEYD